MEWVLLIPLLWVFCLAAILLGSAAISCVRIGYSHLLHALNSLQDDLQRGAIRVADSGRRRVEKQKVERQFAMAAGTTCEVDYDAVEARRQLPILRRVFDKDLPDGIVRCVRMHRLAARAVGAYRIEEIADLPECAGVRQRVVALEEAAMDLLERYPHLVEEEMLMSNSIRLREQILPTCRNCPYLDYEVAYAPLRCPTAEMARIDPKRCQDDDDEAQ